MAADEAGGQTEWRGQGIGQERRPDQGDGEPEHGRSVRPGRDRPRRHRR